MFFEFLHTDQALAVRGFSWALPTPGLQNKIGDIDTKLRTLPKDFKIGGKRG